MHVYHKAYGRDVYVSAMMDPAQVQYGEAASETKRTPLGTGGSSGYQGHRGLDTVGDWTQPLMAMIGGWVSDVIHGDYSSGNTVWVTNGTTEIGFAHLRKIKVTQGQKVKPNTVIGLEGDTGKVTGKHLHTWVKVSGQYADPLNYVTGRLPFPGSAEPANYPNTDEWERPTKSPIPYMVLVRHQLFVAPRYR